MFNKPEDVQEIHAFEEAAASIPDLDPLMEFFPPNAVQADMVAPGWHVGYDKIYSEFAKQFEGLMTVKPNVKDVNIATNGNMACVAMQIQVTPHFKGGEPFSVTFRELDVFKKENGRWWWMQQHIHLPVDPESKRVITDGPLPVRGALKWSDNPLPGPAVSPEQAKEEIRSWIRKAASAVSVDDIVRQFGPGDDVILLDQEGERRGLQEIRDYFTAQLAGIRNVQTTVRESHVDSDGMLGVHLSLQDVQITMKDGSSKTISMRRSDCMRRVNNQWYAFFTMISTPIDPTALGSAFGAVFSR